MNKKLFAFLLSVVILFFSASLNTCAQGKAKKPRVVVVPSDRLLNTMGLLSTTDDMGATAWVANYEKAFLDNDLQAALSKFNEMMKDRGFEVTSLEQELKLVKNDPNHPIPIDIKIELSYSVKKLGPRSSVMFTLEAFDAYSNKSIASASGTGEPAIGADVATLLQEAVLNYLDKFNSQLQATFESYLVSGRESRLTVQAAGDVSLEKEVAGKSIAQHVEDWLQAHCVQHVFSIDDQDKQRMSVSQSMMPLFNEQGKAVDARVFYRDLAKYLKSLGLNVDGPRSGATASGMTGALGSAVLTIK